MADVTFAVSADIKGFQARMSELQQEVRKAAGAAESRFARMGAFLGSGRQLLTGLLGVGSLVQGISRVAGQIGERARELENTFYGQSEGVKDLGRLWKWYVDSAAGGLTVVKEGVGSVTRALVGQNSELRRTLDMYAEQERFTKKVDAVEKARPARQLFEQVVRQEEDNALGDGLAGKLMGIRRSGEDQIAAMDQVSAALRAAGVGGDLMQTLGQDRARAAVAGLTADRAIAAMNEAFARDDEAAAKDFEAREKAARSAERELEARAKARRLAEEDFAMDMKAAEAARLRAAGLDAQARALESQVSLQRQLADIARNEDLSDEQRSRFSRGLRMSAAAMALARASGNGSGAGGRDEGGFTRDIVSGLSAGAAGLGVFSAGPLSGGAEQRAAANQERLIKAVEMVQAILGRIAGGGLAMVPKMV